ncbi:MAG TPA: 4-vinyl reductase [Longimicrobiales bacterium]|nr:4-vinyl reductase [Longimicrobiales bacterium]
MSLIRSRTTREIALPASGLTTIREALRDEAGPVATVNALHAAGFRSGDAVWQSFAGAGDLDVETLSGDEFWTRLSDWFSRRGWGSFEFEPIHPGIGRLASRDWVEAEGGDERQPSCSFTAGLMSKILTRTGGGDIAVIETACRARGDAECHWAFGSEDTVHQVYGSLLEGRSFEDALREL